MFLAAQITFEAPSPGDFLIDLLYTFLILREILMLQITCGTWCNISVYLSAFKVKDKECINMTYL